MFERYTAAAPQYFFARYEAIQAGAPSIGTEHLLLGCREDFEIGRFLHLKSRNPKSQIGPSVSCGSGRVQSEISDFGI
jgi:hypothetical protein